MMSNFSILLFQKWLIKHHYQFSQSNQTEYLRSHEHQHYVFICNIIFDRKSIALIRLNLTINNCVIIKILYQLKMLPEDQVTFLTGIFISIPLGFILRYINNYQIRKYYSLIIGIILEIYVYKHELYLSFLLHIFMYNLIKYVKRQHCGFYAIFTSMVVVSGFHIYVLIVDYGRWRIDISTILMMSVCKYSLFAFSYQDGQEEAKSLKRYQQRIKEEISILPPFIDFLSYMVFLPSSITNTPIDYSTYESFIKKEKQFADIPLKPMLIKFGKQLFGTILCLSCYFLSAYIPTSVYNDEHYMEQGIFHHVWYSFIATNLLAAKYIFGFKLMQLPIHASGVSYRPTQKILDQFQGIRTIDAIGFEKAFHTRDKIAAWNISVQEWLRKCVYERLPYDRSKNQLLTFMVSAFWHGYYPGYYVTFGLYFLQIYVGNLIYKFSKANEKHPIVQLYQKTGKIGYGIVWLFWTWIFVNNSVYFPALSGYTAWRILSSMYFAVPIFLIFLIIFFKIITPKRKPQKKE